MNDILTSRGLIDLTCTTQERPPQRHTCDPRERHAKVLESVIPEQPNISYRMQDIIVPVGNMVSASTSAQSALHTGHMY
jgi:acetyl-CoA carboxylase carboxyltransferase component